MMGTYCCTCNNQVNTMCLLNKYITSQQVIQKKRVDIKIGRLGIHLW